MEVVNVNISDIHPYSKNAKKHDRKQVKNVAESIRQFGFVQPIVLDRNNEIVIGHCRWEAAKLLKKEMGGAIPCVYVDGLSDAEVRALRLADNKLNESAWDISLLTEEIAGLDFGNIEIDWDLPGSPDKVIEDNYEPKPPEEPKAKLGDVYLLGRHRLMCGDSTQLSDVEKLMGGKKADMLLTDPPYNVALGTGGTYQTDEGRKGAHEAKDADGGWKTINGTHVFIEGGEITKGPAALKGRKGSSSNTSSSESKGGSSSGKNSELSDLSDEELGDRVEKYSNLADRALHHRDRVQYRKEAEMYRKEIWRRRDAEGDLKKQTFKQGNYKDPETGIDYSIDKNGNRVVPKLGLSQVQQDISREDGTSTFWTVRGGKRVEYKTRKGENVDANYEKIMGRLGVDPYSTAVKVASVGAKSANKGAKPAGAKVDVSNGFPKTVKFDGAEYHKAEEMTNGARSYVRWDDSNNAQYITVSKKGEIERN